MPAPMSPPAGESLPVRVEWGPVFELLATVAAFLHTDHHAYYDLGAEWFRKIATDAPDAASRVREFAGGSDMVWDHLFGLATETGHQHDVNSFADRIAQMDAEDLRLELLGRHYRPVQRAVGIERIEAAAMGSATAQRDFLRLAWPEDSAWQTGLRQLLKRPASETQTRLAVLLRQLNVDFARYVDPALPALEADATDKRDAAATLDPLSLIRAAIDTAYTPTGDVSAVTLIPSFVIRPFVYYIEHGDQMLFLYPVADRFVGTIGAGPPDRLVRLAAALGDRGRLEILAALKERDMSLKELAERLGLPRSTLRHHVGVLRSAGLLRPMQSGTGFSSYQLREEAAIDLTELVENFLRNPG
jgi:DNA-binding transcriptional ArsR family regulator